MRKIFGNLGLAALAALTASPSPAQDAANQALRAQVAGKVTAARQASAAAMQQYTWDQRTEVLEDGVVKDTRVDMVNWVNGQYQRSQVSDQGPSLPRFGLRRRIAEDKQNGELRSLIERKSVWSQNNVTGEKYMVVYGSLGRGGDTKPLTPAEPDYFTQQFPANQGQFQVRYVGTKLLQSLGGDSIDASYLGSSRTYNIARGKILTELVGTPIELTVYKLGNKYIAARSNEFGYANYELIPAVGEISPLR